MSRPDHLRLPAADPATSRLVLVLVLVLATIPAACSSSEGTADAGLRAGSDDGADIGAIDEAGRRLEGRYAHFDVVAYEGDGMKTHIVSYGFSDLDVVDGELVTTQTFCFSEHRSDQPISVEMPDAATRAIRPEPVAVEVDVEDGRAHLFRPETPTGVGVALEDPARDPLPSDPTDPRIADDDGDGNPGVTARVTVSPELAGEIYLARREIFAYDLDEQPDGSLTGAVRDRSEQLVVGASNPVFLAQARWTQHPDPALSPIILRPVGRDWDCERLRLERDALFPPTPEVDW